METQDSLRAVDSTVKDEKAFKDALDQIQPITDNGFIMELVREYIRGIRKEMEVEVEEVIGVFVRTFGNMTKNFKGETISPEEMETLFMGESMMLDLNNNWYRQFKPIIEPVMANCKISMINATILKNRADHLKHSTDDESIWSMLISSWDFIPWIIFVANGDMKSFISAKEMFRRMIIISKPHFGL